jgi:hypothetical protein
VISLWATAAAMLPLPLLLLLLPVPLMPLAKLFMAAAG